MKLLIFQTVFLFSKCFWNISQLVGTIFAHVFSQCEWNWRPFPPFCLFGYNLEAPRLPCLWRLPCGRPQFWNESLCCLLIVPCGPPRCWKSIFLQFCLYLLQALHIAVPYCSLGLDHHKCAWTISRRLECTTQHARAGICSGKFTALTLIALGCHSWNLKLILEITFQSY